MSKTALISTPQPRLGQMGLLSFLVLASLITPLSLDMYTPAIPTMVDWFSSSESLVNLTLVGYFLLFAIGLLVCGPISDKSGRKPVLVAGSALYAAASFACALSPGIWSLIAFRAVQAFGAGAVSAVATAIVKDCVVEEKREFVLSVVQVMFVVGPVVAPVVGSLVITVSDWRFVFAILGLAGVACLAASLAFCETLPSEERSEGGVVECAGRLGSVAKDRSFMWFLGIVALFNIPFMGYIATGSYIYIEGFGLDALGYSVYFAIAAAFTAVGPFIWIFASRFMGVKTFTSVILGISIASGFLVLFVGQGSPLGFCLTFLLFALMESSARPYSTNVLLSRVESDSGSASALINFVHTAFGSFGMVIAVLPWPSYGVGVGAMIVLFMGIAAILWAAMLKTGSFPEKPAVKTTLVNAR